MKLPKFDMKNPAHIVSIFAVLFLLISIPLTIILSIQSEKIANPKPAQAAGRDPALWPFDKFSPWNLPIAVGKAQYVDAQINMSGKFQDVEGELVFLDKNAPLRTLYAGTTGGERWWDFPAGGGGPSCDTDLVNRGQVHVPDGYIVPDPVNGGEDGTLPNRAGGALKSDGRTIQEFQYATRCSSTGHVSAGASRTTYDIFGSGIPGGFGAHGGSGLSGVGGSLRRWETTDSGPIRHALKMTVNAGVLHNCSEGRRWPAIWADGGYNDPASDNYYGGPVCDFRMGSLTAIHPNVNCQTFVSTPLGKRICQALQDYGAYIVDTGPKHWGAMVILGEYGTASAMNNAGSDIEKMFDNLFVIANNTASTPGGCSLTDSTCTRRQPYAPDFGTNDAPPTVTITSPTNGSTITATNHTITANATDDIGLSKVEFYIDGTLKVSDTTSPFSYAWTTVNGPHTIFARAIDTSNQTTQSSTITVTVDLGGTNTLPSPWVSSDVGSVGQGGSASYNSGTFSVTGSGEDIWGTADEFRFVYQDMTGDGTITARVVSQTNTDPWAKAAVMIREDLTAGSKNAISFVTPDNGTNFQYRSIGGAEGAFVWGSVGTMWVRLQRTGNTVVGFRSSDGTNWTTTGSTTITMGSTVKVGLAVSSHNNTLLSQAQFSNVTVQGGGSGKTGDTNADGKVDTLDLSYLLSKWGTTDSKADINKDGTVNILDLSALLANWG